MSATKLGRLAGLVFVLAVVFGGVGVASHADKHEAGGTAVPASALRELTLEIIWQ